MTSQEPHTQHLSDPDFPDTEVILVEQPAPVFVDSTGRRRRLLRRFSYVFGAFCMVYGGLISLSLAGGPVSPKAVIPFPGLIAGASDRGAEAAPTPTVDAPRAVLVNDATARRSDGPTPPRAVTGHPAGSVTTSTPARATTVRPPAATTADPPASAAGGRTTEATTVTKRPTPAPTSATMPAPSPTVPPTAPVTVPNPGGSGGGNPRGTEPGSGPAGAEPGARR